MLFWQISSYTSAFFSDFSNFILADMAFVCHRKLVRSLEESLAAGFELGNVNFALYLRIIFEVDMR